MCLEKRNQTQEIWASGADKTQRPTEVLEVESNAQLDAFVTGHFLQLHNFPTLKGIEN